MIVFSNTTPLLALASIGRLALLPSLLDRIFIVKSVLDECSAGGPITVPDLSALDWVTVIEPLPGLSLPGGMDLGEGEKDTLTMARQMNADLVLIDERAARALCEYLGLRVTGTLGLLLKAKQQGLVPSFRSAAEAMQEKGIFYSSPLIERLAHHIGE